MVQIREFIDIQEIARVRLEALGQSLDEHDNFSFHEALTENGKILGVGRLYRRGEDIVIDCVALIDKTKSYRELLFRALLLKATTIAPERIIVPSLEMDFYGKFGFIITQNELSVANEDVCFPDLCGCHE